MNNKYDLYNLVKSLNKHEKRFFIRYVKLHNPNKQPQYFYLFNVLNKMEQFDKNQMIEELSKIGVSTNISQLKEYLKKNIFNASKLYDKKDTYHLKDNEEISNAKFLNTKKLYNMAEKILLRLRKDAMAKENSQLHIQANTELINIKNKQDKRNVKIIKQIEQYYEENLQCTKELKEKMRLLHINAKASKLNYSKAIHDENVNKFFMKILKRDLAPFQSEEFLSIENSIIYYNLLFTINSILHRNEDALKAIGIAKKIIESPVLKHYPTHIATFYVHILQSYIYNGIIESFFPTLNEAQLFLDKHPKLKTSHQFIVYLRELAFYFSVVNEKPNRQFLKKISAYATNEEGKVAFTYKNTILKYVAKNYFKEQDYATCRDVLLKITLEHTISIDEFYFVEVNLLEIICYYELGIPRIAKQKLEMFERKLIQSAIKNKNLYAIMDVLKLIITSVKENLEHFEQLNKLMPPHKGIVLNTYLHTLFLWMHQKLTI